MKEPMVRRNYRDILRNYRNYKDKRWLVNQYSFLKKSISQIAKEEKVVKSTIHYFLKKLNIPIRSVSEGTFLAMNHNYVDLSEEAKEFIDGEMLGDGSMHSESKWSTSFVYGSSKEEYIKWLFERLAFYGIEKQKIRKYDHRGYSCWHCSSKYYPELRPFYDRWYSFGKKRIPEDLELTPLVCRQWFIGDGGLYFHPAPYIAPYILLFPLTFNVSSVKRLVEKLTGLGLKATRHSDNKIHIWPRSVEDFISFIGPCPVSCYSYKWLRR